MIEENPVAGEQAIARPIIGHHPVGIYFGTSVRASRAKGGTLPLGNLGGVAEHFTATSIVETYLQSSPAYSLQHTGRAQGSDITGVFGHLEADLNVTLGT